jgi:hypothetical protein
MKLLQRTDARRLARRRSAAAAEASLRPWLLGWLGLPVLGVANGAIREATYKRAITELAAGQVSTAILLGLMTAYMQALNRRWPIPTSRTAFTVGGLWAVLSIGFEFGFGHYVAKDPWPKLLHAYDITDGQVWAAVPLWTALGPEIIRRLDSSRRRYGGAAHRPGPCECSGTPITAADAC